MLIYGCFITKSLFIRGLTFETHKNELFSISIVFQDNTRNIFMCQLFVSLMVNDGIYFVAG
jgi:hypothetical protein